MNSRQLERIFLVILLLLNLFLLAVALSDTAEARRSAADTTEALTKLLEENGIAVSRGAVRLEEAPVRRVLTRDMQEESGRVRRLLGKCSSEDLGGNIVFYHGEKGQAVLRGSGEFDVLFLGTSDRSRSDPEKRALRLMRRIGMEAQVPDAKEKLSADGETVLLCAMGGVPVYNAQLRFTFSGQRLHMLSGTRLFEHVKEESATGMDTASALMRFLEIIRTEGYICSRLDALYPGYLLSLTMSGEGVLTPVWRIQTDTGELLINAESGRIENWLS